MRCPGIGKWAATWATALVLAAATLATAPALAAATPAHASSLPVLAHHGRWLTDPQGRVVILHGVQIDRFKPRTVIEYIDVTPANAAFIGAEGFNVARVSLAYAGFEAQPNRFRAGYVGQYLRFDRLLARAGVYDLLDMMQGQYNRQLDGAGFPDWMTLTSGAPNTPRPFPQGYLYDAAEERAWDNLWANAAASDGKGLQDHYAAGLARLASRFRTDPAFLGFDLLNEPWPGSAWPSCVNPRGCPAFDPQLTSFYRRLIPAIRAVDSRHPVFYEPHALFDEGSATNIASVNDPNAIFTFHNYCLGDQPGLPQSDPGQDCGVEERMVLANAEAQSSRTGAGLLEDEWGNTPSVPLLNRMTAEADADMVGWSYWAFEDCCNSAGAIVADATKPPQARNNLRVPILRALVRPYPQLIAGKPIGWSFDPAHRRFHLSFSTTSLNGKRLRLTSRVEIPALQYPTGFTATVSGARIVSAPDADPLLLRATTNAKTVSLTVTPSNHHRPAEADPVPEDCAQSSPRTLRLRRATVGTLFIDHRRYARTRGRLVRIPAGLADGTLVTLRTARFSRSWVVQRCSLELRPRRR